MKDTIITGIVATLISLFVGHLWGSSSNSETLEEHTDLLVRIDKSVALLDKTATANAKDYNDLQPQVQNNTSRIIRLEAVAGSDL